MRFGFGGASEPGGLPRGLSIAPPRSSFNPSARSSALFVFDASRSTISAPGSVIATVADLRPASSLVLTPTSGATGLTTGGPTISGLASITMGAGQGLTTLSGGLVGAQAHTLYVLAQFVAPLASSFGAVAMFGGGGAGSSVIGAASSGFYCWAGWDLDGSPEGQPENFQGALVTSTPSPWMILEKTWDGTSTRAYVNGYQIQNTPAADATYSLVAGLGFGATTHQGLSPCNIAFAWWGSGCDTTTQRQAMEGYIAARWGLT